MGNQFEKVTTDVWTKRAKAKHGDKFDYSYVNYINTRTKITIICPIHGEFKQIPIVHITSMHGCPKCGNESGAEKNASSKNEFLKKAKEKHGDLYDYSQVNYINARTKVTIICKKHGEFKQIPDNHTSKGKHCRQCNNELLYKGWNEHHHFAPVIKDVFNMFKIEEQFPVEKEINPEFNYLIDFVIRELNLAIEYDEKHHIFKKQAFKDLSRQKFIEEKTGLKFIRISDEKFMKEGKKYFLTVLKENNIAIDK